MTFRKRFGFIALLLLSLSAGADQIELNPAHPDRYTVVKDDTLWDISGKFLQQPWQWPLLWQKNTQIKNPNLIYPGDTIYLSMENGQPRLGLVRTEKLSPDGSTCVLRGEDNEFGRKDIELSKDGVIHPCIRESEIEHPIHLIPHSKIAKFLSTPRVLGPGEFKFLPYVIGFAGEHVIGGAGERLYVRDILTANDLLYTVFRSDDTYISPDTGEILGYEAKYIGEVSLEKPGDPATLLITKSNGEIREGDRLMTNRGEDSTINYFARPPSVPINGNIISVFDGVSQIGLYNVVVIDKGRRDGLEPGHVLNVLQRGKIVRDDYSLINDKQAKLPNELAGQLMVFRTFERISYALVMKTNLAIHLLDKVKTP